MELGCGKLMGLNPFQKKQRRKRNKKIFKLYYELGFTMEEIGKKFGITRERVRQILKDENARLLGYKK